MPNHPVSIDIDWPVPDNVKVISTTRTGGESQPPFDSFNLGLHTADNSQDVLKNRATLVDFFNLPAEPVWLNQVHGKTVLALEKTLNSAQEELTADASWTRQNDSVCAVMTADCLPVFITDTAGSVVGVAHGGWKGLLAGVVTETLRAMGLAAQETRVYLGPAIGAGAFIVGEEVLELFRFKDTAYSSAFSPARNNRWHCDIYKLARTELALSGVKHVYGGNLCTFDDANRFYSYRRDGENTGRMAHLIWMTAKR